MATAEQVIRSALLRIMTQGAESPLDPSEYAVAMFTMNTYMLDLDASGITLGYTEVSDIGDNITIPTGALRGLISNLAIELAPYFNGKITPGLLRSAEEGIKTMRRLGVTMSQTRFPSTLPIGSGNEKENRGIFSDFYSDEEAQILAETTGAVGLEIDTDEAAE